MKAMIVRDEKVMDESFERMVLLLLKQRFDFDFQGRKNMDLEFDRDSEMKYRAVEEEILEMGTGDTEGRYDYTLSIFDDKGCLGLAVKVALALSEGAPRAPNMVRRRSRM